MLQKLFISRKVTLTDSQLEYVYTSYTAGFPPFVQHDDFRGQGVPCPPWEWAFPSTLESILGVLINISICASFRCLEVDQRPLLMKIHLRIDLVVLNKKKCWKSTPKQRYGGEFWPRVVILQISVAWKIETKSDAILAGCPKTQPTSAKGFSNRFGG